MDSATLATGLDVSGQIPLDTKTYVSTLASLIDFSDGNKKYKLHRGMIIHTMDDSKEYRWLEVGSTDPEDYRAVGNIQTYPSNIIAFGINYSNKTYQFFEKLKPTGGGGEEQIPQKFMANKPQETIGGKPSIALLDETNYELKRLVVDEELDYEFSTLPENKTVVLRKKKPLFSWTDKVILDPNIPTRPVDKDWVQWQDGSTKFIRDYSELTNWITEGQIILAEGSKLELKKAITGSNLLNLPKIHKEFSNVKLDAETLVVFSPTEELNKNLTFEGKGKLQVEGVLVTDKLTIKGVELSTLGGIEGGPLSKIVLQDVDVLGEDVISTSGHLQVKGGSISGSTARDTGTTFSAVEEAFVEIEGSTINVGGVIEGTQSSNAKVELKGNTVADNVVEPLLGNFQQSSTITTFGNNLNMSRLVESPEGQPNVKAYNDITMLGLETTLQAFESREIALTVIGPNKMFFNTGLNGGSRGGYVDYTTTLTLEP